MKKNITILLFFSIQILYSFSQEYKSSDYKNFEKANQIFDNLEELNYQSIDTIRYELKGTWFLLGHYATPKLRVKIPIIHNITASTDKYESKSVIEDGKNKLTQIESVAADSCSLLSYGLKEVKYGEQLRKGSNLPFYSPITIYMDMIQNKASLRYIGEDQTAYTLSYHSSLNKQISVDIDKINNTITRAKQLKYKDIDGDYHLDFKYENYKIKNGHNQPTSLLITEWEEPLQSLVYQNIDIKTKEIKDRLEGYKQKELDKNLYLITLPTEHHQSFLIDFGDYLGIIETPISEKHAQEMADYIKSEFPDKPIKYIFLTHHHPDHAGGFAYFYKNGSCIITTELSRSYQLDLLARKHLLRKDSIKYTNNGNFEVISSLTKQDFSNKSIKVVAYEMGENSHTKEFILYYFPTSKILIVGDLFYTSETGIYPSIRAKDISNFIKKNKIKVEKIYQTWDPGNCKEFSTLEDLNKSVEMYDNKNKTGF